MELEVNGLVLFVEKKRVLEVLLFYKRLTQENTELKEIIINLNKEINKLKKGA